MKNKKTIIVLITSIVCLGILLLCFSCQNCKKDNNEIKYNCITCFDCGVIDCPHCHVARCNYEVYDEYCLNGRIWELCDNCDGRSYIKKQLCSKCDGSGYVIGTKCSTCNGSGLEKVDCRMCSSLKGGKGYKQTYRRCKLCNEGYIGGSQCSDKCCTLPFSDSKFSNYGYTYIDCPDCEK